MPSIEITSTRLNPVQLHLLELFSKNMTEKELHEIKEILVEYYRKKVDEELDAIWEKQGFTKETFKEKTKDLHLRSKKKTPQ